MLLTFFRQKCHIGNGASITWGEKASKQHFWLQNSSPSVFTWCGIRVKFNYKPTSFIWELQPVICQCQAIFVSSDMGDPNKNLINRASDFQWVIAVWRLWWPGVMAGSRSDGQWPSGACTAGPSASSEDRGRALRVSRLSLPSPASGLTSRGTQAGIRKLQTLVKLDVAPRVSNIWWSWTSKGSIWKLITVSKCDSFVKKWNPYKSSYLWFYWVKSYRSSIKELLIIKIVIKMKVKIVQSLYRHSL